MHDIKIIKYNMIINTVSLNIPNKFFMIDHISIIFSSSSFPSIFCYLGIASMLFISITFYFVLFFDFLSPRNSVVEIVEKRSSDRRARRECNRRKTVKKQRSQRSRCNSHGSIFFFVGNKIISGRLKELHDFFKEFLRNECILDSFG